MDRLVEIRLMIEGLNAQRQEINTVEEALVNEYNKIIVKRQEDERRRNEDTSKTMTEEQSETVKNKKVVVE